MPENNTTLIGVLVDVSGSMKTNVGDGVEQREGEWVRSIFQVIDDLIKYDVSEANAVFALGFGASFNRNGIFDILNTLKRLGKVKSGSMSHKGTVNQILYNLEAAGASSVRKWAQQEVIMNVVPFDMSTLILSGLKSDKSFAKTVVDQCLPRACKGYATETLRSDGDSFFSTCTNFALSLTGPVVNPIINQTESFVSSFRPASKDDIKEVLEKTKSLLLNDVSISSSIFNVQDASDIMHGCTNEKELTENRLRELMDIIKPFIFGGTPLYGSLKNAHQLFSVYRYCNHKKLLFILSDGMPNDEGDKERLIQNLKQKDVVVVSCLITRSNAVEPHTLYSQIKEGWEDNAKFMFELSSKVPTQLLPRTIFLKRGWKIDIKNNETKLFMQVNHPDNIKEACDLARNAVCCQDALSDILVSVALDIYINQSTTGFGAPRQTGGTCYANASAAVLHLSMKRVLGRDGGYPNFKDLRQELIDLYGIEGADTFAVLENVCPKYRLHCRKVDIMGAMHAITAKRPVVARFRLTDVEWEVFSRFYKNHKTGVLTRNEIDLRKHRYGDLGGHAVVLTSFNSECLYLMNSWGVEWGDNGFFRVQNADVLHLEFIDVYWTLKDLKENEIEFHKRHGSEIADKLMKSLTSLQVAKYQCPKCKQTSLVTDYTGHLTQAICPKCHETFNSNEAGNILALNMHLTSLSRGRV